MLVLDARAWGLAILAYCAIASLIPVWLLLQPRGYLGGFVLYTALALGVFGVLFGGYEVNQPALAAWDTGRPGGQLFPFLFVTIACGACSGFHGLVCSGTTSKQVDRESLVVAPWRDPDARADRTEAGPSEADTHAVAKMPLALGDRREQHDP